MANRPSRVFTIPASAPFLPALVDALLDGRLVPGFLPGSDPLALATATLYLPTRRACRLARDVFLDALGVDAALLPRIVPVGDVDEDELAFAENAQAPLDLPLAIGGFERRLLLAQLVRAWANTRDVRGEDGAPLVAGTPAAALALADDLARLIDDMATRQVPFDRLDGLVPGEVDVYWQLTLDFLKIARVAWPAMLEAQSAIEPATRRDLLIAAEARRLQAHTDGPVIAAGSTGSMPATAKLLSVIATLPQGAVVLPGLDTDLDETSWASIGGNSTEDAQDASPGHPQFALFHLLRRMGLSRADVIPLCPPSAHGRERFVSEALRPATTTPAWRQTLHAADFMRHADAATATLCVIEAASAEEEALAIAVALRECADVPDKTAALVTPDRSLARRVLAALERWNVAADDSGGDALAVAPAGTFARLAAEAALNGCAPVTLLALLKHPLLRLGAGEGAHRATVAILEQAILRGPRPAPGTAGLTRALDIFRIARESLHPRDLRKTLDDTQIDAALALVARLSAALAAMENLSRKPMALATLAAAHLEIVAALGGDDDGRVPALAGVDGNALGAAFEDATAGAATGFAIAPADYLEFFTTMIGDRVVRRPEVQNVRIRIFGPLEARLQSVDRLILGELAETVWPPETRTDPWLSRPMRAALGLDLPERRIGLSAHDFAQAFGAREVFLTRAGKRAGAPTVASRFAQRVQAVAGEAHWHAARARGAQYVAWARTLDDAPLAPIAAPAPRPPREARPTRLSVTEIEDWLRDPYTIYARHILALRPFEAIDTPPGARDRGSAIHAAVERFTKNHAKALPDDVADVLIALGEQEFAAFAAMPEARAFWWPRFLRIADWFANWEKTRRPDIAVLHAEIGGRIEIALGARSFTLTTRADRIEQRCDGSYGILDYKTGAIRTERQVRTGLAPQLTLEGAILRQGGFKDIGKGTIGELTYVQMRGGDPAGKAEPLKFKTGDADSHSDEALARLTGLAARFEDEATPYRSLVHPMWSWHYGDYDHLARVREWSMTGGSDGDAGGGE